MALAIHGLLCGHLETDLAAMLPGVTGRVKLPIPAYVIEHTAGTLVFDTGLHADLVDSQDKLGRNAADFTADLGPGHDLAGRLAQAGIDGAAVEVMANSHFHFDHVGGNAVLPNARLLVQAAEWKAGHHPKLIEYDVYDPADFDCGQDVHQLDGEHDVFGDGTVVLIPTPGHTAGHQSLRVETASGPVVLTADACYFRRSLDELAPPTFGYDLDTQRASMRLLAEMEAAGATLVFGHDPDQWADTDSGIRSIAA